jgi:hypothetical protein
MFFLAHRLTMADNLPFPTATSSIPGDTLLDCMEKVRFESNSLPDLGHEDYEYLFYMILFKLDDLYRNLQVRLVNGFITLDHVLHDLGKYGINPDSPFTVEEFKCELFSTWHLFHDPTFTSHLDEAIRQRKYNNLNASLLAPRHNSTSTGQASQVTSPSFSDIRNTIQGLQNVQNPHALLDIIYRKYRIGQYAETEDKSENESRIEQEVEQKQPCLDDSRPESSRNRHVKFNVSENMQEEHSNSQFSSSSSTGHDSLVSNDHAGVNARSIYKCICKDCDCRNICKYVPGECICADYFRETGTPRLPAQPALAIQAAPTPQQLRTRRQRPAATENMSVRNQRFPKSALSPIQKPRKSHNASSEDSDSDPTYHRRSLDDEQIRPPPEATHSGLSRHNTTPSNRTATGHANPRTEPKRPHRVPFGAGQYFSNVEPSTTARPRYVSAGGTLPLEVRAYVSEPFSPPAQQGFSMDRETFLSKLPTQPPAKKENTGFFSNLLSSIKKPTGHGKAGKSKKTFGIHRSNSHRERSAHQNSGRVEGEATTKEFRLFGRKIRIERE